MSQKYTTITRKCPECGIEFTCKSGGKEYKNCCSRQCSNKYLARQMSTEDRTLKNKSISEASLRRNDLDRAKCTTHTYVRYDGNLSFKCKCSRVKCKNFTTVNKCAVCGIDIFVPGVYKSRTYCSPTCAGKVNGKKSAALKVLRSKNEVLFYELCLSKYPDAIHNQPIFDGWDADVIIPSLKLAILWNGIWHYKDKLSSNHSLKQVQSRDSIKLQKIKEHGYESYVIKDMGKYNPDFVKQEFEKFLEYISSKVLQASTVAVL